MVQDAYIFGGVRTPFAKVGGALAGQRPDDLAALVVESIVAKAPALTMENSAETLGEVILGNANGAGEENRNVARMAWLLAGALSVFRAPPSTGFAAHHWMPPSAARGK